MYIENSENCWNTLRAFATTCNNAKDWAISSRASIKKKVHRLTPNQGVGSSDPKYGTSLTDEDIVNSSLKDEAVINGAELTTPHE